MQGFVRQSLSIFVIRYNADPDPDRICHSPKGWTDQELGSQWLERDFEPATKARMDPGKPDAYQLLILDGHNSHCTYKFIKFAREHRIIVLCLPSHMTHKLQPCDVGVFGPLAAAWKKQVSDASRKYTPLTKLNMLVHYHAAREAAFKSSTILSAFEKTGIHPFNRNIIPTAAFAPALNTTTKSAQPIPATIPSIVTQLSKATPTPSSSVAGSAPNGPSDSILSATTTGSITTATPDELSEPTVPSGSGRTLSTGNPNDNLEVPRFTITIPKPLTPLASRVALCAQNSQLRQLIANAAAQMERDYAQMRLMDQENERLCQIAFTKQQAKAAKKETTTHARILTNEENTALLERAKLMLIWKSVFSEAKGTFKLCSEAINQYHARQAAEVKEKAKEEKRKLKVAKEVEEARKKALNQQERALKKLAADAAKAIIFTGPRSPARVRRSLADCLPESARLRRTLADSGRTGTIYYQNRKFFYPKS